MTSGKSEEHNYWTALFGGLLFIGLVTGLGTVGSANLYCNSMSIVFFDENRGRISFNGNQRRRRVLIVHTRLLVGR